jgi:hypothetical protein
VGIFESASALFGRLSEHLWFQVTILNILWLWLLPILLRLRFAQCWSNGVRRTNAEARGTLAVEMAEMEDFHKKVWRLAGIAIYVMLVSKFMIKSAV